MSRERFWESSFWIGRIDARIVALFRIAFSVLLLVDLVERVPDLFTFYGDDGVLPRAVLLDGMVRVWRLSLFDAVGSRPMVALLFALGTACVGALLVGYRTRLASAAVWLFVLSLHERNLVVLDSADTVIRVLSFWLIFADSGAVWSLDVRLRRRLARPFIPVAPLRVMQLQVAVVYLWAAVLKTGPTWQQGTAIYHAMQLSDWVRPLGRLLLAHPGWCEAMTRAALVTEGAFLVLAFSPVLTALTRAVAILSILGLHAGIFLTMRVGMFSLLMPVTMLLFVLPAWIARVFGPAADSTVAEPASSWRLALRLAPVPLFVLMLWTQLLPVGTGRVRQALSAPIEVLGLWQNWAMFAPDPLHDDGYWQAEGQLTDGSKLDVLAAVLPGMRADRRFRFDRWIKLRSELFAGRHDGMFRPLGSYVCRTHNRGGGAQLVDFQLVYYRRPTVDPGKPLPPYQRDVRWEQRCSAATLDAAPLRPRDATRPHQPIAVGDRLFEGGAPAAPRDLQ